MGNPGRPPKGVVRQDRQVFGGVVGDLRLAKWGLGKWLRGRRLVTAEREFPDIWRGERLPRVACGWVNGICPTVKLWLNLVGRVYVVGCSGLLVPIRGG